MSTETEQDRVAEVLREVREENALAPTVVVAARQAEKLDEDGWIATEDVLREAYLAGLVGSDEPSARDEDDDNEAFDRWLASSRFAETAQGGR